MVWKMNDSIIKDTEMSNDYLDKRLTQVENHTFDLDDTIARLTLELSKSLDTQLKQTEVNRKLMDRLNHHETVWARIDNDVQLFGNKVVGCGLGN